MKKILKFKFLPEYLNLLKNDFSDDADAKIVDPIRVVKDGTGQYSVAGGKDEGDDAECDSCCCHGHCVFQHGQKCSSNITSLLSVIDTNLHDAAHLRQGRSSFRRGLCHPYQYRDRPQP